MKKSKFKKNNSFTIIDCTLRDGGYYNSWDFPIAIVDDYLIAMSAANVDFVVIGFRFLNNDGYIYIEVPDINSSHFSDPTHCFTYNAQSLKYVLEKNNFEILALETNKIYGKIDPNIPRKKLQKNLHCLAKKNRINHFEPSPNQGIKIYNEVKINHSKVYNLYLYQQSKKVTKEFLDLIIAFISKIISKFSYNQSINFYEKYKLYLKKILGIFK